MHSHRPRKRFGQNFLQDRVIIDRIIQAVSLKPNEHAVEIGPGHGALTKEFLKESGKYITNFDLIELDRDLIPELQTLCVKYPACHIHQIDALKFDFENIFTDKKLRIIGNLPYNISTPILFHLLKYHTKIQDMHFMLQREVAERLAAKPKTPSYGRLSVMVQYDCKVEILFFVPARAFYPIPQVESAFVRLTPYVTRPCTAQDSEFLAKIVREAFNHRRKTIHNSLKGLVTEDFWKKIDTKPNARAEELSVAEFVQLVNALNK